MTYPTHLLPTTVVGSYPQPDWLVDRAALEKHGVPRTHAHDIWRIPDPICSSRRRTMARSWRSATWSAPASTSSPTARSAARAIPTASPSRWTASTPSTPARYARRPAGPRRCRAWSARSAGAARWNCATSSSCCDNTDRATKITLPGPFTLSQQAKNEFYADEEEMAMDYAVAVNEELRDLKATGVDVVQLDEPWVRTAPDKAVRYGVRAINRALEGIDGPTVVHLCFGYAARGAEQADRLRLPAAARRHGRAADLDRGGAATARSRRAGRSVGQADHAGRARPWQRRRWKRRSRSPPASAPGCAMSRRTG